MAKTPDPYVTRHLYRFDEYQVFLGETVAGFALGYNFGDGHLHGAFVLNEVQARCGFEKGEAVQIWVESCPLFGTQYEWFIRDATDAFGHVEKGDESVHVLKNTQPY